MCYPSVTDSESGHDRFLFTVDCFGSAVQTLFLVCKYFIDFVSGFIVAEFLPDCTNVHIYFRFVVRPTKT